MEKEFLCGCTKAERGIVAFADVAFAEIARKVLLQIYCFFLPYLQYDNSLSFAMIPIEYSRADNHSIQMTSLR